MHSSLTVALLAFYNTKTFVIGVYACVVTALCIDQDGRKPVQILHNITNTRGYTIPHAGTIQAIVSPVLTVGGSLISGR